MFNVKTIGCTNELNCMILVRHCHHNMYITAHEKPDKFIIYSQNDHTFIFWFGHICQIKLGFVQVNTKSASSHVQLLLFQMCAYNPLERSCP